MNASAETIHGVVGSCIGALVTFIGLMVSKRTAWKQASVTQQEAYYTRLHGDLDSARDELDAIREERVRMQDERLKEREEYATQIMALQHDKANLYANIEVLIRRVRALEERVKVCESCPHPSVTEPAEGDA